MINLNMKTHIDIQDLRELMKEKFNLKSLGLKDITLEIEDEEE